MIKALGIGFLYPGYGAFSFKTAACGALSGGTEWNELLKERVFQLYILHTAKITFLW